MNRQLPVLIVLALGATLTSMQAQFAPGRGGMTAAAPAGPGFGGATAKLFGDNQAFSASLEMQAGSAPLEVGKLAFSEGKSRFDVDMIKAAGSSVSAQAATQMRAMGMDTMAMISRPDKSVTDLLYPGLNAYVETSTSDAGPAKPDTAKTDITRLGTETVDGHPCVKNKVVVTESNGTAHESTVWNASDLKDFPVKIVQTEGGTTTTMTFKDIKLGKVDATVFDVPSGAKKYTDVGTMMQTEVMARAMRGRGGQ